MITRAALVVIIVFMSNTVFAVVDVYEFATDAERERYQVLIEEMRCPKCQNQNLAGSDSPIAKDLRREIHRMVIEGESIDSIKTYMVARYGDYVLYRPRLSSGTAVLWGLPIALLLIGLVVVVLLVIRRRNASNIHLENDIDKERLASLLNEAAKQPK